MTEPVIISGGTTPAPVTISGASTEEITVTTGPPSAPVDITFAGTAGPAGPAGPAGAEGGHYRHTQSVAATVWIIEHNLGYRPAVTITDSAGTLNVGDVRHLDANTVRAEFINAFGGYAECS